MKGTFCFGKIIFIMVPMKLMATDVHNAKTFT